MSCRLLRSELHNIVRARRNLVELERYTISVCDMLDLVLGVEYHSLGNLAREWQVQLLLFEVEDVKKSEFLFRRGTKRS